MLKIQLYPCILWKSGWFNIVLSGNVAAAGKHSMKFLWLYSSILQLIVGVGRLWSCLGYCCDHTVWKGPALMHSSVVFTDHQRLRGSCKFLYYFQSQYHKVWDPWLNWWVTRDCKSYLVGGDGTSNAYLVLVLILYLNICPPSKWVLSSYAWIKSVLWLVLGDLNCILPEADFSWEKFMVHAWSETAHMKPDSFSGQIFLHRIVRQVLWV